MKLQQLMSYTRRAIDDYNMIQDGDRIAIGISGGKDSLTLLSRTPWTTTLLSEKFDLEAITVDLGHLILMCQAHSLCETMRVPIPCKTE